MDKESEERARRDLNPVEDVKGAIKYVEGLHPIEKIKEMMETAAEVLEPSESDLRVVEPEEDTESDVVEEVEAERPARPTDAHPFPDVRELNKEHRGY